MKLGILTFHRALNYGAVLQTYALQTILGKLNNNVEIIDYRPEFNEKRFKKKKLSQIITPKNLYFTFFRNGYITHDPKPFYNFRKSFLNVSESIAVSTSELNSILNDYDAIICGSDQIWNLACTENDINYFLPFELNKCKKISYSASFGVDSITPDTEKLIKNALNDFNSISVRETAGVKIASNITNKDVLETLDPSMLLDISDWSKIKDDSILPTNKYLLIYLMSEDKELLSYARKIAKQKGLEIIYINNRLFKSFGMSNLSNITPEQFISLFINCSYVITNSFHGTCFSIILNKDFNIKLIPRSIANSRLKGILNNFNLSDRIINDDVVVDNIDFSMVNKILNSLRFSSMKFIKDSL